MPTPVTDADLVTGHLAGDRSALAVIYDRYSDTLYDTAAAMLRDRTEAADVLQDTILIAAERLGQLRDPTRLKPWLFAILRNEVYRRSKKRKRTVATDFSGGEEGFDVVDDRQIDAADAVSETMAGDEFATMLRGAAAGLDERDQLVLELSVRQGLEGQDLADALGVSANQSYTLVHRMRERVERSLGAYAIARAGRKDCDELDTILKRWDGEFTVLIRKRVARHIDNCSTCSTNRTKVAPLALFAGAPALAAPPELRDRILTKAGDIIPKHDYGFTADGGFPEALRGARRIAAWVAPTAAASVALLAGIAGFAFLSANADDDAILSVPVSTLAVPTTADPTTTVAAQTTTTDAAVAPAAADPSTTVADTTTSSSTSTSSTTTSSTTTTMPADDGGVVSPPPPPDDPPAAPPPPPPTPPPPTNPPTTVAPRPGEIQLSGTIIDLGTGDDGAAATLTNVGELPVDFAVGGSTAPFSVSPSSGTLQPGQSAPVVFSLVRGQVAEGPVSASAQITGDGRTQTIDLRATIARPPVIGAVNGPQSRCFIFSSSQVMRITADVGPTDESPPMTASFSVSGPQGQSSSTSMVTDIGRFFGGIDIPFATRSEVLGSWSWSITVTDALGNSSSTSGTHNATC